MNKYFLLYYIVDKENDTQTFQSKILEIGYKLNSSNIRRLEIKLKSILNVKKVVIVNYKLLSE